MENNNNKKSFPLFDMSMISILCAMIFTVPVKLLSSLPWLWTLIVWGFIFGACMFFLALNYGGGER